MFWYQLTYHECFRLLSQKGSGCLKSYFLKINPYHCNLFLVLFPFTCVRFWFPLSKLSFQPGNIYMPQCTVSDDILCVFTDVFKL